MLAAKLSAWNSYALCLTSVTAISSLAAGINLWLISGRIMKLHIRGGDRRSGLLALMPVIALLTVTMLAKLGAATQLFHLAHWNTSGISRPIL